MNLAGPPAKPNFTLGQALETGSNTGYHSCLHGRGLKAPAVKDEPAAYQLVGGVMAHQGDDGCGVVGILLIGLPAGRRVRNR